MISLCSALAPINSFIVRPQQEIQHGFIEFNSEIGPGGAKQDDVTYLEIVRPQIPGKTCRDLASQRLRPILEAENRLEIHNRGVATVGKIKQRVSELASRANLREHIRLGPVSRVQIVPKI